MRSKHIEDDHQKALITWAKFQRIKSGKFSGHKIIDYLFAIPNGGRRNAREAARLKAQGVKAGVSDLMLAIPSKEHHGLWIEMKKPIVKGKVPPTSEHQKTWIERMLFAGFEAKICYGFDQAKATIEEYLK